VSEHYGTPPSDYGNHNDETLARLDRALSIEGLRDLDHNGPRLSASDLLRSIEHIQVSLVTPVKCWIEKYSSLHLSANDGIHIGWDANGSPVHA
jgi:hypothetical protein